MEKKRGEGNWQSNYKKIENAADTTIRFNQNIDR